MTEDDHKMQGVGFLGAPRYRGQNRPLGSKLTEPAMAIRTALEERKTTT